MKKLFYIGLVFLALFEILKVYFIMPMPGSQQMNTIDVAYALHTYRWYFRIFFSIIIVVGSIKVFQGERKWIPSTAIAPVLVIIYFFNFRLTADKMFLEPESLKFEGRSGNALTDSTVVVAVAHHGEAKAYPLRFIIYHHQVRDTIGGKPLMITYCSVCRTGRVYEPVVNGQPEQFRLVGMDHFNAMFEDKTTKSWWMQATGEAVAGPLKGNSLPEIESTQLTANKFFSLYPFGVMMQADDTYMDRYDSLGKFEWGKSKSKLTGTDSLSWKEKSWVIGIQESGKAKAYDWNLLKEKRVIHDVVAAVPIVIALCDDDQSYVVFQRASEDEMYSIRNDTLITNRKTFNLLGHNTQMPSDKLKSIQASQEFWHSWRTFHPDTEVYDNPSNPSNGDR